MRGVLRPLSVPSTVSSYPARAPPRSYPALQAMAWFYYGTPFFGLAAAWLLGGGAAEPWLQRYALVVAGAAAEGQFTYIYTSLASHHEGPVVSETAQARFLLVHGALALVPQVLAALATASVWRPLLGYV